MATNPQADLFLAILALDAYNRGYSPGMIFNGYSNSQGTMIGDATIQLESANASSSFYALAYTWHGEAVISYRGTRFDGLLGPNWQDITNGWTVGAGYAQASQAQMALKFYTQVQSLIAGATDTQVIDRRSC
jgi:hypothetical protein